MAITDAFTGSETVGTTEWSLTTDTAGPDVETSDGIFQLFLDVSAVTAIADLFELKVYEKVESGGTQRRVQTFTFGPQTDPHMVFPCLILMHGWDMTLKKLAGTDRAIAWSIRKVA